MMNLISEYTYQQLLRHSLNRHYVMRTFGRCCASMRQLILKIHDPLIRMKVGRRTLIMNLSHNLPSYMMSYRYYNTALVRIASFLKERQGYLTMIDVGANIGDTVSLVSEVVKGDFLCIEGDEKYYQHLLVNTKSIDNVICVKAFCDQKNGVSNISLVRAKGSSRVSEQSVDGDLVINKVTVDSLIEKVAPFKKTNFIKIDTDGYDYKVIRGCDLLIAENKPTIFFELCPQLLRETGENPASIFDYLLQRGYRTALFYDNVGFPVMAFKTDETKWIAQLMDYSNRKETYFDVLIFHDSQEEDFGLFYKNEKKFFEKKLD